MALTDYRITRYLGSGYFGTVYLALNKALDREQALKIVQLPNPSDSAQEEARVLERFRNYPNIVMVENASVEQVRVLGGEAHVLSIAMEYLPLGSLAQQATAGRRFGAIEVRNSLLDILTGLDVLHAKNYLHRDIKPSNVLVANSRSVKLSDFGLTTLVGPSGGATPFGYEAHKPPEVVRGEPYTRVGDIYAVGVTGFRLSAWDEFDLSVARMGAATLAQEIVRGRFPPRHAYPIHIPPNLKTVINKAMRPDPHDRYQTVAAMKDALYHLTLECEWVPDRDPIGPFWSAHYRAREYRIRIVGRGQSEVITERQATRGQFRRISQFCSREPTPADATDKVKEIMLEFVMGRVPG